MSFGSKLKVSIVSSRANGAINSVGNRTRQRGYN